MDKNQNEPSSSLFFFLLLLLWWFPLWPLSLSLSKYHHWCARTNPIKANSHPAIIHLTAGRQHFKNDKYGLHLHLLNQSQSPLLHLIVPHIWSQSIKYHWVRSVAAILYWPEGVIGQEILYREAGGGGGSDVALKSSSSKWFAIPGIH